MKKDKNSFNLTFIALIMLIIIIKKAAVKNQSYDKILREQFR